MLWLVEAVGIRWWLGLEITRYASYLFVSILWIISITFKLGVVWLWVGFVFIEHESQFLFIAICYYIISFQYEMHLSLYLIRQLLCSKYIMDHQCSMSCFINFTLLLLYYYFTIILLNYFIILYLLYFTISLYVKYASRPYGFWVALC